MTLDIAKLKEPENLLLNAQEVASQLRQLADNEIDSDSFAVVTENYNGREVEFERPITELAIDAAGVIDGLIAALEAKDAQITELEVRKLEVIIPPRRCHDYAAVAVQQRDEQWYKALHDACGRSGINLETGGE